jgi:hypothetical protein
MSVIEARLGGRRLATQKTAERRKKLLLIGLMVAFAGLLVLQLPKLLSSSESTSTAPAASSTVSPAVTGSSGAPAVASAPAASSARVRAIRRLPARDPFVPLIRENAASAAAASAPAPVVSRRAVRVAVPTRVTPPRRAVARAVKPTAAVIVANGRRQVVGIRQAFKVGEATLRLVAVRPKTMRFKVDGSKRAITVRKGHRVTLVNQATGVRYSVRFSAPTRKS